MTFLALWGILICGQRRKGLFEQCVGTQTKGGNPMESFYTHSVCIYALMICSACLAGTYSGGTGTAGDPYRIGTAADWVELTAATGDWGKQFILTADIDLTGVNISPVSPDTNATTSDFQGTPFSGVLDGKGHAIRNAQILKPTDDFVGLFGCSSGRIGNLEISQIQITGRQYVGGLAGRSLGSIEKCRVSGDVSGDGNYIGGLVGENKGPVESCTTSVTVSGRSSIGGLIGAHGDSITGLLYPITDCVSTGSVTGSGGNIGGLVGTNNCGLLIFCYATVNIDGTGGEPFFTIGGLVGRNRSGSLVQCYATGNILSNDGDVGGLVGSSDSGWITACYATGNVTSLNGSDIGGLVGGNRSVIRLSYATGIVEGGYYAGGLVGTGGGTISDCFALGRVSGIRYVGGFAGSTGGSITTCYSAGAVSGGQNVGGFSGYGTSGATNCFWDREASGQTTSTQGKGRTTAEMMTESTFTNAGWNFTDIWTMNGYPRLRWEHEGHVYSGGDGTQENPYQIGSIADWQTLMKSMLDWRWHFVLTGDLDFSGLSVTPIGNQSVPFIGNLNGRGHRISNLYMHLTAPANRDYVGLFGYVGLGGQIRNLGLEKVEIGGNQYVGGLAGYSQGIIAACYVTGMVNSLGYANGNWGGVVGTNYGTVANCYAKVQTSGYGLVGDNANGTITTCYSSSITTNPENGLAPVFNPMYRGTIKASFCEDLGGRSIPQAWSASRTTAEMRKSVTFTAAGWDFVGETVNGTADIWRMCEDGVEPPRLAWEFSQAGDFVCPDGTEMTDLLELAGQWLKGTPEEVGAADGSGDRVVDFDDFALLGEHWLFRRIPNLVLHVPLDGDFLSSVGGYSGTPQGDPVFVPETDARVGSGALELDPDDGIIMTGYKGILGNQPRTCMAWLKTEFYSGTLFWWGDLSRGGGLWEVGFRGGKFHLNTNGKELQGVTAVNTGQWVHVAVVLPDRTDRIEDVRFYINGVEELNPVVTQVFSSSAPINTLPVSDFRIGCHLITGLSTIVEIDDVRIYDWAMSREEIAAASGIFGADAGKDRHIDLRTETRLTLEGKRFNASSGAMVSWEKVSGPDGAVIGDPTALSTPVEFSREGDYVFRLTATDGAQSANDEVTITVTNGEIGYWTFDGNLSDLFGHHGNAVGWPVFVPQNQARLGTGAIDMNGDDYVVTNGFTGITGTKVRTCMAWIKTTATAVPIVYWGDKNTTGGLWEMWLNSTGQFRAQFNDCGISSVTAANTGQWVHIAAVLPEGATNAADVLLYVNGVLETGGAVTAGAINTGVSAAMRIGADEASHYFTGLIDDVRVYNRALTAEEIAAAMGQ